MTLSIANRITLLTLLPAQVGSFREMRDVKRLRDRLAITEDELALIEYTVDGERAQYNGAKANTARAEYEFTESELQTIGGAFALLEASGQVPTSPEFIDLYDSFEPHIDLA